VERRLKRGEIWTAAGGQGYAGKPRPVVIVQDDRFRETRSVTICGFTGSEVEAPYFRLPVKPSETNGLREVSHLMVDKFVTLPREKLCRRIGHLDEDDVVRVNRAMMVFLGLSGS
jgi:mRNA interferase MazF